MSCADYGLHSGSVTLFKYYNTRYYLHVSFDMADVCSEFCNLGFIPTINSDSESALFRCRNNQFGGEKINSVYHLDYLPSIGCHRAMDAGLKDVDVDVDVKVARHHIPQLGLRHGHQQTQPSSATSQSNRGRSKSGGRSCNYHNRRCTG